jgi:hypothetical protein
MEALGKLDVSSSNLHASPVPGTDAIAEPMQHITPPPPASTLTTAPVPPLKHDSRPPQLTLPIRSTSAISVDEKDEFSPIENTWSHSAWDKFVPYQHHASPSSDLPVPDEESRRRPTPPSLDVPLALAEMFPTSPPRHPALKGIEDDSPKALDAAELEEQLAKVSRQVLPLQMSESIAPMDLDDSDEEDRNSIECRYEALELFSLAQKIKDHKDGRQLTPRPGGADAAGGGMPDRAQRFVVSKGLDDDDNAELIGDDKDLDHPPISPLGSSAVLDLKSLNLHSDTDVAKAIQSVDTGGKKPLLTTAQELDQEPAKPALSASAHGSKVDNGLGQQIPMRYSHIKQLSHDVSSARERIFDDLDSTLKTLSVDDPSRGLEPIPERIEDEVRPLRSMPKRKVDSRSGANSSSQRKPSDLDLLSNVEEDQTINLDDLDRSAFLRPLDTREREFDEA